MQCSNSGKPTQIVTGFSRKQNWPFYHCLHSPPLFMPMSHEALNPKSKNEVHPLKQECFPAAVLGVQLRTGPASPSLSVTTGARGRFLTLTANQRISILSLKPVEDPNHHYQALTIIGIHQVGVWCPRTKVLPQGLWVFPPKSLHKTIPWIMHSQQHSGNSRCGNRHHLSLHVHTARYQYKIQQPTALFLSLTVNQLVLLWNSLAALGHRPQD